MSTVTIKSATSMGPVRASGWSWGAWNDSQMRFPQALTWVIFQTLDLIYATELCFSCQIVSDSFATLWILACQAPLSMGFPKQAYWSGLLLPPPRDLPNPGVEPASPALAGRFFTTDPPGKLHNGTLLRVLPWSKGSAWISLGVLRLRLHLPLPRLWSGT